MITIPKFRTASKQNIRTFALPSENQTYTFKMQYAYDSYNRIRLSHLRSYIASGTKMQDITYSYDSASNITHVSNSAGSVSGLGGRYEGHYTYDNLYRLVAANGYWKNSRDSLPFSESMNYTANGRILKKTVNARILSGNHSTTKSSDFRYNYAGHGNQVSTITDNGTFPVVTQSFQWDDCGNVDRWAMLSKTGTQWLRTHTWTEDNRLQTVADNNWFSYYQYDAGGERTYKLTWAGSTSNRSGDRSIYYTPDEATLYASPYFVVTSKGYTKHYYAESERITSQLGKGQFADVGTPVVSDSLVQVKLQEVTDNVEYPSTLTVPSSGTFAYLDTLTNQQNATSTLYFYHPDHLGSSSWITTTNGTVKQHLHYLPWGETYVDQKSNRFDGVRYTFSAKEKDTETGYSYFGARYYSSDLSVWLSVDPMSDKYAYQSGYVYCGNNPIKIIDPNGMWEWDASGNLVAQSKDNSYTLAAFLGTSPQNAMTILSRSGVTADNNGILNLKSGQVLSKHTLYIDHGSGDFPTVKDNMEAIAHYYSGNGKPASVGLLAALAILKSDKFKSKHNKITTMGTASPEGYFSVDLTSTAQFFHIGETGVDYYITGNGKTSAVTYTLFTNTDKNSPNKTDGFWDPNFIIETTLGKVFNRFSSDEKGNKLELGGTPYPYAVRKITFFYKPVEE